MPLDPSISLKAGNALVPPAAVNPLNAFDMLSKYTQVQNAIQTMQARRAMGDIFATSPDTETAVQRMMQSPWAPYALDSINAMRQMENMLANTAKTKQETEQSALTYLMKQGGLMLANPNSTADAIAAGLSVTTPSARGPVFDAVRSVLKGWQDVPAEQRSRVIAGSLMSNGFTPEMLNGLFGTPHTVTGMDPVTGLRGEQGAVQAPSFAGGAMVPSGPVIVGGMTPGEAITPHPIGIDQNLQPRSTSGAAIFRGQVPGMPGSMPNAVVPPSALGAMPQTPQTAPIGVPTAPAPGQTEIMQGAGKNYTEEGRKTYESAAGGLASIQYMRQAFDDLEQRGGWTIPGTAANARLEIARTINTIAQAAGADPKKLPFDTNAISNWEDLTKQSKTAGFQLVNQMFGGSREAASIVNTALSAVPTVSNTPEGGRLILNGLEQAMIREIDKRNFETAWIKDPSHNLIGVNEAFNNRYPSDLYARRAISSVQPYEISSADDAANYLPGTILKQKGTDNRFIVTPGVSKYKPVTPFGLK